MQHYCVCNQNLLGNLQTDTGIGCVMTHQMLFRNVVIIYVYFFVFVFEFRTTIFICRHVISVRAAQSATMVSAAVDQCHYGTIISMSQ